MDGHQFDDLTRTLASDQSRRGFLTRLTQLGAALGLAGLGVRGAEPGAAEEEEDPKDAEKQADYCAEKSAELAAECATYDDEKEEERCEERVAELCDECPDAAVCDPTSTIVNGALTEADPVFAAGCATGARYDAYTFQHPGGPLSLAVRGASSHGGTLPNPHLYLVSGGVPSNLCPYVAQDANEGCGFDSYLELTNLAEGTYTAVVLEEFSRLGTYTFERNTFSGPEVCPA